MQEKDIVGHGSVEVQPAICTVVRVKFNIVVTTTFPTNILGLIT